eukprot:COSAG02_NODE_5847_length_3991_cov_2.061665_1_plen_405_part_10
MLVSVLVLRLAQRLRPELPLGAELAALLFASHPVHTEAVCNTVGRAELLSAALFLASTHNYAVAAASFSANNAVARGTVCYVVACCSAVCAAWCKETGLMALIVGTAEDLLRQVPFQLPSSHGQSMTPTSSIGAKSTGRPGQIVGKSAQNTQNRLQTVQLPGRGWWLRTGIAAVLTILFLVDAKTRRGKRLTPAFSYVDNPISHGSQVPVDLGTPGAGAANTDTSSDVSSGNFQDTLIGPPATPPLTRNLSGGYITAYYFWILFWPVTLSPDYSFAAFPLVEDLLDARNVATGALLIALFGLGMRATCQLSGPERVGSCIALLILVLPLLPACQLFLAVGTVLGERLLYIPSIGFCLIFGWAADASVATSRTRFWQKTLVAGACCFSYAILTFQRTSIWYDDATL